MADPSSEPPPSPSDDLTLTFTHHSARHTLTVPRSATISDLSLHASTALSIPPSRQKWMISPKVGLLRPPFRDPLLPLTSLQDKKIVLMGSTAAELSSLDASIAKDAARTTARQQPRLKPTSLGRSSAADWRKRQEESTYTFTTLRPLAHLPNPARSLRFLERLRDDAGIRAAMRKHKWTVPLLTEMDPAEHTTHESRTLGLNRNRGEVIELRLRTDAYDGYRDYRTIRRTLCHELTHNVWGEHDARFWELCRQVEKEVERGDWKSGGKALSSEEVYEPAEEEEMHVDHGAWMGGEYVLGGGDGGGAVAGQLSRRDILARAAEHRMRLQEKDEEEAAASKEGES